MTDFDLDKNRNVGYEPTDAKVRPVIFSGLAMLCLMIVVFLLMAGVLGFLTSAREKSNTPRSPLAPDRELPSGLRLQVNPEAEWHVFKAKEDSVLNSYGWVQRDAGVVRIPVAEAMEKVLERGLPVRPDFADWMSDKKKLQSKAR